MSRKKHMSPGMISNVANFEKTKQLDDRNEAASQIDNNPHLWRNKRHHHNIDDAFFNNQQKVQLMLYL